MIRLQRIGPDGASLAILNVGFAHHPERMKKASDIPK
jgi:hypothetical protein